MDKRLSNSPASPGPDRHRLGIPEERVLTRIAERGNTSSASIPITLAHYAAERAFSSGDVLVLASFGGGMAIDVAVYRWP